MVLRNVLLGPHTTFGIGGPASSFAGVGSSVDRDANVFVDDGGFDGLVVRTAGSANVEVLEDGRLRVRSGVTVDRLIDVALAHGPSGLEHFAGIPSSLGGALWQNLHFLSPDQRGILSIGELVGEATVLAAAGGMRRVRASRGDTPRRSEPTRSPARSRSKGGPAATSSRARSAVPRRSGSTTVTRSSCTALSDSAGRRGARNRTRCLEST